MNESAAVVNEVKTQEEGSLGPFTLGPSASQSFARLSGDFNPLHLDPIIARRLSFGTTVNHGVHVLMHALDQVLNTGLSTSGLKNLKVVFHSPVLTGAPFSVEVTKNSTEMLGFVIRCEGKKVQTVRIAWAREGNGPSINAGADTPTEACEELSFEEAAGAHGTTPLGYDHALLTQMFPALASGLPDIQLTSLLAATRIIGMHCPGYHSLFIQIGLDFEDAERELDSGPKAAAVYRVGRSDKRSSYLDVVVEGPGMSGNLVALYRPPPVPQPAFATVAQNVDAGEFVGQRALVIGGSRGLGEVAAKIIAAGGGEVWLTYATGADDAKTIVTEIKAAGGTCGSFMLDATKPPVSAPSVPGAGWRPTHLYFFATPTIAPNKTGTWDQALYDRFRAFYVDGFKNTVETIRDWWPTDHLRIFLPSTLYIDDPQDGLEEYVQAKVDSETAARELAVTHPELSLSVHRLPPMATDQTNTYWDVEQDSALPVLAQLLRSARILPSK